MSGSSRGLEDRLAAMERELAVTRAQVNELRQRESRRARVRRWWATAALLPIALVAFARHPSAQNVGQTVKAPFVVTDDAGRPIFRVHADAGATGSSRGFDVVNEANAAVVSGFVEAGSQGGGIVAYGSTGKAPNGIGFTHERDGTARLLATDGDGKPALDYSKTGLLVRAPLNVVDTSNRPIAKVTDETGPTSRGVSVYNAASKTVVAGIVERQGQGGALVAYSSGQGFTNSLGFTHDADGTPSLLVIGTDPSKPLLGYGRTGLRVRGPADFVDEQDKRIASIQDKNETSARGLLVYNPGGNVGVQATLDDRGGGIVMARSGDAPKGQGAALYVNAAREGKLAIQGADGKVFFDAQHDGLFFYNGEGKAVAQVSAGASGGLLSLQNNAGSAVVEAGVMPGDIGIVRVYPRGGPAPLTPMNFLMGWRGKK